ncbi:MAG: Crp/Fnr family transcriptional regulator [Lachnospiraceae bacterium]|nr:Crp/Fnr family transcriptional regulator [Lachnospiraceae bacterium]
MKKYSEILKQSSLFAGISEEELFPMLKCLEAGSASYKKNQFIYHMGDQVENLGMVAFGSVSIIQEDFWGNRNIVSKIMPGQLFAETYACTPQVPMKVSVLTDEPTTVLFFNAGRVLTTCPSSCTFHSRLIRNLVSTMARKNLMMNEKIAHVTQRSTREKLLSYLSAEAIKKGCSTFEIPFNRQQLADYLSVDRSAMSNELGKLRDEGLLEFRKSEFTLLE